MKTSNTFKYILWLLLAVSITIGCDDDSGQVFPVTGVSVPDALSVFAGQKITIQATGFEQTDELFLRQETTDYNAKITTADASTVTFSIPSGLKTGVYSIGMRRGGIEQIFGIISLTIKKGAEVPNKEGATVKGRVFCAGEGIPFVVVSDGEDLTMTDEEGYYWLESKKYHGYIFISIPSGYEVSVTNAMPEFWAPLTNDLTNCEQHDFELTRVNNDDHIMVVATDMHLANRNDPLDYVQFANGFMPDVKSFTRSQTGKKVYGMNLGDLSFDVYWYSNSWALLECKEAVKSLPFPLFSAMGNHDNDPYCAGDFEAEKAYKKLLGPSYYSFNIGKIHYIILDNNVYLNLNGSQGTVGDRDFDVYITEMQLAWLKKDLEYVEKTTPIVVGLHCPVYTYSWSGGNWFTTPAFSDAGGSASGSATLTKCFAGYNNVQYLTGHTHVNRVIPLGNEGGATTMMEHNIAAVCGTWWWTQRYAGNNVCKDGSPDGYKIFEMNGTDIKWYYKPVGGDPSTQFRAYDMNEIKTWFATDPKAQAFVTGNPTRGYADVPENTVWLNVWAHDKEGWKISVREDSRELTVSTVRAYDPLHAISYDVPRCYATGNKPTASFMSNQTSHLFSVQAASATSTLEITVTDRFGNKFTETMIRPKAFSTQIK